MTTMTPDAVAKFLSLHPEFFEQYADVVADLHIPHPHGGRAISISERQIIALRDRAKQLEHRLREIISFGEENDAIGEKVHRLTVALLGARDLDAVLHAVHFHLREDFAVPHIALRAWRADGEPAHEKLGPTDDTLRAFASGLAAPSCGPAPDGAGVFGDDAALLKSFSYIPLRAADTFGVLVLASEDPQRFFPEMGTVYLKRIGDMVSAALQPYTQPA